MMLKTYFGFTILNYLLAITNCESQIKEIASGDPDIVAIIEDNSIYVDKTGFILNLTKSKRRHNFMARPRRFGKSLLLNTMKEIWEGNKELFKNCKIGKSDYSWKQHKVLLFDFSTVKHHDRQLENSIMNELEEMAEHEGIYIKRSDIPSMLKSLVRKLAHEGRKNKRNVVILIDEYDAPIVCHLEDQKMLEYNLRILKEFYATIKGLSVYIRFSFVMGVTKFSLTSLYSGANHFQDLTNKEEYDTMLGFTKKEIENYYSDYIRAMTEERTNQTHTTTNEDILDELKKWYDGYHFSKSTIPPHSVYNPLSTMMYFENKKARNYWIASSPSFINSLVKKYSPMLIYDEYLGKRKSVSANELLTGFDVNSIDLTGLLFQTGYLTIYEYEDTRYEKYWLQIPNHEVEDGILCVLLRSIMKLDDPIVQNNLETLGQNLDDLDLKTFFDKINQVFSNIPSNLYEPKSTEKNFHAVFHTILYTRDIKFQSEYPVHRGTIDVLIERPNVGLIYIIEMKIAKPKPDENSKPVTADHALQQIKDKEYANAFLGSNKTIVAVGMVCDLQSRKIVWKEEH